ncbi:hypothetical protein PoB_002661700 [Plakobranchus ocellatus]|uniref:Uncharacterized protein n=1 Tax=Plakobranchus ocellatus TaxID=259542 RepID=A0AAV3ZYH2_9GAST|nr:hypothetical protein PoB_002661700 [Plakobranchus ocellatus]
MSNVRPVRSSVEAVVQSVATSGSVSTSSSRNEELRVTIKLSVLLGLWVLSVCPYSLEGPSFDKSTWSGFHGKIPAAQKPLDTTDLSTPPIPSFFKNFSKILFRQSV